MRPRSSAVAPNRWRQRRRRQQTQMPMMMRRVADESRAPPRGRADCRRRATGRPARALRHSQCVGQNGQVTQSGVKNIRCSDSMFHISLDAWREMLLCAGNEHDDLKHLAVANVAIHSLLVPFDHHHQPTTTHHCVPAAAAASSPARSARMSAGTLSGNHPATRGSFLANATSGTRAVPSSVRTSPAPPERRKITSRGHNASAEQSGRNRSEKTGWISLSKVFFKRQWRKNAHYLT
jgi:hypothetical protein